VDSLDVDWNAQAVRSAKQYLQMTGFSCKGLIEQLSSEYGNQYSVGEATYGAKEAGAC
jgi:Host cell surface-exposed lipoprotein